MNDPYSTPRRRIDTAAWAEYEAEARTRSLSDQMAGAAVGAVSTLRQQRDLVEAEVLRRMGETR